MTCHEPLHYERKQRASIEHARGWRDVRILCIVLVAMMIVGPVLVLTAPRLPFISRLLCRMLGW